MSDQAVSISNSNNVVKKSNAGRPLLFQSVAELDKRIKEYFDWCDSRTATQYDKNGNKYIVPLPRPYTISGLAEFLECDRKTLNNYKHKDEYFPSIARALRKCERYSEEQLYEGNDRGAKFALMNNYGWQDKQDIDISVGQKQVDLSTLSEDDIKRLALQAKDVPLLPESE